MDKSDRNNLEGKIYKIIASYEGQWLFPSTLREITSEISAVLDVAEKEE